MVRQLRQQAGISQAMLAEGLGVSVGMVSKMEQGSRTVTEEMLARVRQVVGASPIDQRLDRLERRVAKLRRQTARLEGQVEVLQRFTAGGARPDPDPSIA